MIRTALAGLGAIGVGAHLPALMRHPRVDLVALIDPDAQRRERACALATASSFPMPAYASLAELKEADDVQAVVLATPPWVTPALAQAALERGWYVLAEKPVGTSVAAAEALLDLPGAAIRRLQVGLTYRHHPAFAQLRTWLNDGVLGEGPVLVRAHIYDEVRDPAAAGHAALIETALRHGTPALHEGSHVFDWLRLILGEEPSVDDVWSLRTDPQLAAANFVGSRLSYGERAVALVEFGWYTAALPRAELTLTGADAHVHLDLTTFSLVIDRGSSSKTVVFDGDRVELSFDNQLDAFISAIETGGDLVPSLHDGIAVLATAETIDRAARCASLARVGDT